MEAALGLQAARVRLQGVGIAGKGGGGGGAPMVWENLVLTPTLVGVG